MIPETEDLLETLGNGQYPGGLDLSPAYLEDVLTGKSNIRRPLEGLGFQ